jgi:ribosomal protein L7Ae-like RNA K-turn-binding protein
VKAILNMLGLCARAGRLITGEKACVQAIRTGGVYLALLDEAKVEVSMLRRTEDTVYESQINELTEGLKGVE